MKTTPPSPPQRDLCGYEVLVAVCGGIAAYKVCSIVSALVQRGSGVSVAMTAAARKFVGPLTFQALSGRRVLTSLWSSEEPADVQHVGRTDAADLMLIAPATANIIGKTAAGIADDLVSTLAVSMTSPVLLAPTMNDRMWANKVVQENLLRLKERGFVVVGPSDGWLACGSVGPGRMAEPADILNAVETMLKARTPKSTAGE
ncbi:MAG: flavoprotein [Phycisphaerae bacterium]